MNSAHEWRLLFTYVHKLNCFIVHRCELCYCTPVCTYNVSVHKCDLNKVVRTVVLVYKRVNTDRNGTSK